MTFSWILTKTSARWALAGPAALLVAIAVLAGMPVWWPPGPSNVDHALFALVLFPAVWGMAFFYAVLSERLWLVSAVFLVVFAVNIWFGLSSMGVI